MELGVRELRAHLSRYIKEVAAGEEIVVTDRGKPVARITRVNGRSRLDELIEAGLVEPPTEPKGPPPSPVKARGTVGDLVKEQRR